MDIRSRVFNTTLLGMALLCLCALQAHGQTAPASPIPLQLNGQAPGVELNLFVSADRQTKIYLTPTATLTKRQYTITAINFPVAVALKDPGSQAAASPSLTSYLGTDATANPPANTPSIIPLILTVDVLPQPGDQYAGNLLITAEGSYPALNWKVNIKPANGVLVVDMQTINRSLTRSLWGGQSDLININIREKTGRVRLDGVSARLEQIPKSPSQGFDLEKNVDFFFNGEKAPDFTQSPSSQSNVPSRSIAANNGLATVGLLTHGLNAGEYNVVMRFQSTNSNNDDAKLILNLQVRDHWLWSLLTLLGAVIASFVLTKIVASRRQRSMFMKRIEELQPAWLSDEPQLLPVVWAQSTLKQSQDLSKRFWLTGEDQIEARVTKVEKVMDVLEKIRLLRNDIQNSNLRKYVKYRAIAKLNGILSNVGYGAVDDAQLKELNDSLTSLRQWLDETAEGRYYWQDFRIAIRYLLSEVEPTFSNPLYLSLKAAEQQQQQDDDAVRAVEDQYVILKLLWERRNTLPPELVKLKQELETQKTTRNKEEVFALADRETWNRLNKSKLEIKMPTVDDINHVEAYTPVHFSIEPAEESLADSYLFRHGLKFKWTLTFVSKKRHTIFSRKRRTMKLIPLTEEPEVIQYFPTGGEVKVSVEITWSGDLDHPIILSETGPLAISSSRDFGIYSDLEKVQYISFAAAAGAAILTGFMTFYLKNSGFGSLSDYLSLFAWGAGVDQGKNFIQNLQTNSQTNAK